MSAVPTSSARASLVSRRIGWTALAVLALLLAMLLSLAIGSRQIAPSAVFDALLHGGGSDAAEVVRSMRLPRTVVGVMVGAALAMAGTVMQGITRNPIADPGILGISQGASVAVVLAIAYASVHT
ncbi:iron chelate uptake ABC transporter family permease subunit, partial [Streptomyces sp. AC627_RSS907]